MSIPERLRLVGPAAAVLLVTGLAAAWIGMPVLFTSPLGFEPLVLGIGVFFLAPLFFALEGVGSWAFGGSSSTPVFVVLLAMVALTGSPCHALVRRRWAVLATIVGLIAWLLCQGLMVSAARSI